MANCNPIYRKREALRLDALPDPPAKWSPDDDYALLRAFLTGGGEP